MTGFPFASLHFIHKSAMLLLYLFYLTGVIYVLIHHLYWSRLNQVLIERGLWCDSVPSPVMLCPFLDLPSTLPVFLSEVLVELDSNRLYSSDVAPLSYFQTEFFLV